ncbi:MAG: hypothetical protein ABIN67_23825 [Ferruginibacter sp.]
MRTIYFTILLLTSQVSFAQIKLTKLTANSIPKGITYVGQIKNAVRWTDNLGDNIVLATETGETASKNNGDDSRDAALYAHHYLIKGDSIMQDWKLYDFIKDCPVDITAGFIKNSFAVTDLNKNGIAEIWLMYKTACHGDVSPANMKIIMYEDNKKHAVRGTNKVKVSEKDYIGGEYSFDEAFKKVPVNIKEYAKQLWKKNIMETWD